MPLTIAFVEQADDVNIGPIQAAFVSPGVTVIVGSLGTRRETNSLVAHRPALVGGSDISFIIPTNEGADRGKPVGIGEAMSEAPAVRPEDNTKPLTFAQVAALMRRKVEGRDGAPLGGGGGGRRPRKPLKMRAPSELGIDTDGQEKSTLRWRVEDMTRGEIDFYHRQPGLALRVLRTLIGAIIRDEVRRDQRARSLYSKKLHAFNVFGLSDIEAAILRHTPGAARRTLIDYAREHGAARIADVDRT